MVRHLTRYCVVIIAMFVCTACNNQISKNKDSQIKKITKDVVHMEDINHLASEKSPYLLQHADNPVHWYPWSDAAFEKAKREDKPILLSIGYSTCHWCHVMERESFENNQIAEIMNQYFVSIKVDREERPDIDHIYMTAVMSMTGQGGWPLTVFLDHDKKPFYGGTYFPPEARWGYPGFPELMNTIHERWVNQRDQIQKASDGMTALLSVRSRKSPDSSRSLDPGILNAAYQQYDTSFDTSFGGFGTSPKFPTPHNLSFLLRYWKRTKQQRVLDMVEFTLLKMADGGIYDHLAGGFHRYSTDQIWQIPHFEKMLYDQALISKLYVELYQITKNPFYARVAREIYDYVLREMQSPEGGFYSAQDADSFDPDDVELNSAELSESKEKKEGAFYVWRFEEIGVILGDNAPIFNYYYGINEDGNAESDPHGEFTGKNIIYVKRTISEVAQHFKIDDLEIVRRLEDSREKLLIERAKRPAPYLDDKVLTDWNGLMISSLAFASGVLKEKKYLDAAEKSANFILNRMENNHSLMHRFRDGDVAIDGMLDDYAFMIDALLELYAATFNTEYLTKAFDLQNAQNKKFWDVENGGYYFTSSDAMDLIYRHKDVYDGAIPSGNSMSALNLSRLIGMSFNEEYTALRDRLFSAFTQDIQQRPSGYAQFLMGYDYSIGPSQEIVIAASEFNEDVRRMQDALNEVFLPNKVALFHDLSSKQLTEIYQLIPFLKNQVPIKNSAAMYVCENHQCKLPLQDIESIRTLLQSL